jgi:creatinine amidohydrolase/Fe(II)-dependent formamide hydrolase-like protein
VRSSDMIEVDKDLRRDDRAVLPLGSTEHHSHLRLTADSIPVVPDRVTPYFCVR